jgi:predicted pyridoxine 5'-phosphate oxidase superfamily flavin-nucleotide-binding protein
VLDPSRKGHAHAERRLRTEPVAWLTTVRADGQAQASPVWFLWDGDPFVLCSQPGAQVEPDSPRADRVDGYLARYQAAIEALGYEPGPFARTYSLAIRVRPTRVRVS